eukprot:Em0001g531a
MPEGGSGVKDKGRAEHSGKKSPAHLDAMEGDGKQEEEEEEHEEEEEEQEEEEEEQEEEESDWDSSGVDEDQVGGDGLTRLGARPNGMDLFSNLSSLRHKGGANYDSESDQDDGPLPSATHNSGPSRALTEVGAKTQPEVKQPSPTAPTNPRGPTNQPSVAATRQVKTSDHTQQTSLKDRANQRATGRWNPGQRKMGVAPPWGAF